MSSPIFTGQKLFNLLPALYRIKDAQLAQRQNLAMGPLQSLLAVIEQQIAVVAADLDQLYDDQFIETCAPWVIPYIGDLIGYQSVYGVAAAVASPRAEVANTISLRRRKGTVLVLEQLARDVTGWGAHAVEFFRVLADTQYMNHIRPYNFYAPNLRRWEPLAYMNTGFDDTAHTVDLRRVGSNDPGRYNIQNIGIFLWSLNAYSLTKSQCSPVAGTGNQCYRFSTLGRDVPLFNNPVSQGTDITAVAQQVNVADILLREVLCRDIKSSTPVYYGAGNSVFLYLGASPVDPAKIQVCDLSGADGSWNNIPTASSTYSVAIDPELGRIAVPPSGAAPIASFYYGFNADMGGGEYGRLSTFAAQPQAPVVHVPGDYATVSAALGSLGGAGVVEISDSATYTESSLAIAVNTGALIELRAADGCRPTLLLGGEMTVSGGAEAVFDVNGLLIALEPGAAEPLALIHVPSTATNKLSQLGVNHCTVVPGLSLKADGQPVLPGKPVVFVEASGVQFTASKSILGSLWINAEATASIADSIVDAASPTEPAYVASAAPTPGGALTLTTSTVIGKVYAMLFTLISDCIFVARLTEADQAGSPPLWSAALWSVRRQQGCVRFSYLPTGAITPRQFECVTDAEGNPKTAFYSLRYGDPGYAKLIPSTSDMIRRGADDGGEMGAFHFLLAPMRETDLRTRMQEYLPVNLEFGIFYQT